MRSRLVTLAAVGDVNFGDGPGDAIARPHRPGTSLASPGAIRSGVRAARRRADVVVVSFHWGSGTSANPRELDLGRVALAAGADAVIGAHPHVLQQIRRRGHQVIAYSLGNFVFSARSPETARTGILRLGLPIRGVDSVHLRSAVISDSRPVLVR